MATATKIKPTAGKPGKDDEGEKKGHSTKKLIIVAVGIALLVAAAAYFLLGMGGGGGDKGAEKKPATPSYKPGAVLPIEDAITINLADGHYLKLKMSLQGTTKAGEELDGSKALDLAVSEFSYRSLAELASTKSRDKLKADLVAKVTEAYEGEVMGIYFTEFVMQ